MVASPGILDANVRPGYDVKETYCTEEDCPAPMMVPPVIDLTTYDDISYSEPVPSAKSVVSISTATTRVSSIDRSLAHKVDVSVKQRLIAYFHNRFMTIHRFDSNAEEVLLLEDVLEESYMNSFDQDELIIEMNMGAAYRLF